MEAFIAALGPLFQLIFEALTKGVSTDAIATEVKALMRAASDAEMKREYPDQSAT